MAPPTRTRLRPRQQRGTERQSVAPTRPAAAPEAPAERKAIVPPFQIEPVKQIGERRINILVYGPYGHGKTTFAASALDVPSMEDVLFVAAEPGDMSLTDRRSLDIITINKYSQLARIYDYLTLHCKWRDEGNVEKLLEYERQLKATVIPVDQQTPPAEEGRTWFEEQRLRTGRGMDEPFMYRTVILDSISEMHKYLVYKFTGVDIGKTKIDDEIERMEEWQPAQELFRLLIRSFRDLPMNFIAVSAEDLRDPDRKKGQRHGQYLPKLAGQMAGDIAGFLDIVGYLVRDIGKDGETKRYLYLGAGYEEWISKHRFSNLPDLDYIENPTLSSLLDLARKDAERHGSSPGPSRPVTTRRPVAPVSHTASPAAPQRSRPSGVSASRAGNRAGRGNRVRR